MANNTVFLNRKMYCLRVQILAYTIIIHYVIRGIPFFRIDVEFSIGSI